MAGAIRLRVLSIIHTHTDRERKEDKTRGLRIDPADGWTNETRLSDGQRADGRQREPKTLSLPIILSLCAILYYIWPTHTHILESSQGRMSVDHHLFNWAFLVNNSLATNQGRPPSLLVSAHLDSRNNGKAIRQLSLIVDNEQFWPPSITDPFHKRQSLTRYSGPCCC